MYVGVSQLEYARITYETGSNLNAYYATGAHLSVTSGRIAYTFGLKGPAMAGVRFIQPPAVCQCLFDEICRGWCHTYSKLKVHRFSVRVVMYQEEQARVLRCTCLLL